jgi:drug/metabolite transporter (DMT)-like permease
MLLMLSVLWGGTFLFNGIAVKALPVLTVVVCRVGIASLLLWGVLLSLGTAIPASRRVWAAFLGMGLLNNVIPFTLIVWGQTHISSGLASILNATTPLFTVAAAHWFTADERLTAGKLAGAVLGLAGVVVLIGPSAMRGLGVSVIAQMACLGAALSYAFAGIYGRRFKLFGIPPLVTAAGQVTASAALLAPAMLVIDRPWLLPPPGLPAIGALLALATLATAFAFVLYFRILATAGATNLLLVTFLIPVSAIALGVLVLGESLEPRQLAGMTLIGIGLAAIDGRAARLINSIGARTRAAHGEAGGEDARP